MIDDAGFGGRSKARRADSPPTSSSTSCSQPRAESIDLAEFSADAIRIRLLFSGMTVSSLRGKPWSDYFGERGTKHVRGWIIDDFRVTGLADD